MRPLAKALILSVAVALSGAAAICLADDGSIKTIARGARRDALAAMAYKPFDAELWGKVEGWTGGAAPTRESTGGKPVLIVAWASWYTTSHAALGEAKKIADKYPDVVVVGVHHRNGFDKAPEIIRSKGATFAIGHDSKGEFYKALRIEAAGPNYYLVDRAGNLRFLDVDKSSLDAAAKIVSDESAGDASRAEARSKEDAKGAGEAPMGGPDVKSRVTPADYKAVKWPAKNKSELSAKDMQGKPLPAKLGKEKYLGKAPDREGKIVVLDFWATWCGPCKVAMPHLDDLAKRYPRDVVVIGISDEPERTVSAFIKRAKHSYPQAVDEAATVKNSLGVQGIPHVAVISTDGVVRWQGNPHPSADLKSLEDTVKALVEIDPGVKARQANEKKPG
ncbi:MAG TPA: TlpA disulfide reductase family protein [Phycisphaerales bacterium]|nr:TlpA disulfide reductase family protein [Phycisphaerales bacterium]